jgi:hypothetical protein
MANDRVRHHPRGRRQGEAGPLNGVHITLCGSLGSGLIVFHIRSVSSINSNYY